MTSSEQVMWSHLRGNKLGFRFRHQCAVGAYVLDFYCPEARLCVETDGEIHAIHSMRDVARDAWLLEHGIETIRVPTLDLFERLEPWLILIQERCAERARRPAFTEETAPW